jgi:hypothetical protein
MTEDIKAKCTEYMRQYRKNINNLAREQELARERYRKKHPIATDAISHPKQQRHPTTQQKVATSEISHPKRVLPHIPPQPHPPPRPLRPPIEDEEEVEIDIEEHPRRYKDNAEKCRAYAERKRKEMGENLFLKHQAERKAKWRKKTGKN